jgi:uncharacterized protein YndB with AHSA1/START domain
MSKVLTDKELEGLAERVQKLNDKQIDELWYSLGWVVEDHEEHYNSLRQQDIDAIRENKEQAEDRIMMLINEGPQNDEVEEFGLKELKKRLLEIERGDTKPNVMTPIKRITVEATINAPTSQVWDYWTMPKHITKWNQASEDWHSPRAENDLKEGGKFNVRMESRDGKQGFDFEGKYNKIKKHEFIEYVMSDGRRVSVKFVSDNGKTRVVESFDPENTNSQELQKSGWQAILDNFKKYVEGKK